MVYYSARSPFTVVLCIQQDGFSPLMVAAEEGHLSVVELLIAAKAQVNHQDKVN